MKTKLLAAICLLISSTYTFAAPAMLRWRIRSVETKWKTNMLTGIDHDFKQREKLNIVTVKMYRHDIAGKECVCFDTGKMKNQRTDQSTKGTAFPWKEAPKLQKFLVDVLSKMSG